MGYSERHCQFCGISFNIGRIRRQDEPPEAAWSGTFGPPDVVDENQGAYNECKADACQDVPRSIPAKTYRDGSASEPNDVMEHIAGPHCTKKGGYSGWRISLDEMRECTWIQCIAPKLEGWSREDDDEDFEVDAQNCFITGISENPPDEFDVGNLNPVRHGVAEAMINNGEMLIEECTIPMHPACFSLFKRLSVKRLGTVDIDGVYNLTIRQGDMCNRFEDFPSSPDLTLVDEQFYSCVPGTEYLAAHPLRIPGLDDLMDSCVIENTTKDTTDVAFSAPRATVAISDPFAAMSPEIKVMLLLQLSRADVANLRLASRCFAQLPQVYFHQLIQAEMPWVWEIDDRLRGKEVDWYQLWCKLTVADGGSGRDEQARQRIANAGWGVRDEDSCRESPEEPNKLPEESSLTSNGANCKQGKQQETRDGNRRPPGEQWPKSTELRGLRNRRRICGDIDEIITRIVAMDAEVPGRESE